MCKKQHAYFLVLLIHILIFVSRYVGAVEPNPNKGSFYIAHLKNVVIDGELDEWQDQVPVYLNQAHQAKYVRQDWGGVSDCSAKFWWSWNDRGIFIAAETIDDSIAFPFTDDRLWADDCIQFAFDIHDDNAQDYYQHDDHEFVVTLVDSQPCVYEYLYGQFLKSEFRPYPCQVQIDNDTIRYEVMIPWTGIGIESPLAGKQIGASLVVFDNDGQDYRGWLEWTAGIIHKKFTLPFANVLLFDPGLNAVQSVVTQSFLSESDTVLIWVYSRYSQRKLSYRLLENNETIFHKNTSLRGRKWHQLAIPLKYLQRGWLQIEIASWQSLQKIDIAVWSKRNISEQIAYLAQQVQVLKGLNMVDPSCHMLVKYWIDWLQSEFSSAVTNFDFFNVMNQAQNRIDQVPNFYMNKPVYYNREYHIVEHVYHSKFEDGVRRYLAYLPTKFDARQKYPLYIFLHDNNEHAEASARKIAESFSRWDLDIIGIFPVVYPDLEMTHLSLSEIMSCIDDISQKYAIVEQQVYLAGQGSGSIEALILAQHYPDRFAAITSIFGSTCSKLNLINLKEIPIWIMGNELQNEQNNQVVYKFKEIGGKLHLSNFSEEELGDPWTIFTPEYFQWLLIQKNNLTPLKISFQTERLQPSRYYWFEASALSDYFYPGRVEAVADSNKLFISTENMYSFSIWTEKLPNSVRFPLAITIDLHSTHTIYEKQTKISFDKINNRWKIKNDAELELKKTSSNTGPLAAIFNRPLKFVYSTRHNDPEFNKISYDLARRASQRGLSFYLDHFLIADTVMVKSDLNSNIIIFGNEYANAYLKKLSSKLPVHVYENGLKLGNSICTAEGVAALYIYPNPQNPNYLILVGIAPDMDGMRNISNTWDMDYFNTIFLFDYLFIENGVVKNKYRHWIDFGYFDKNWQLPWFQPLFDKSPKVWFSNLLVGFDANQLSFNSNWRGGGKGSFTWKIYSKIELKYQQEKYNWQNTIYGAFGQISVQEEKHWKIPEKSNDNLDFDSVLRFTLEKFIDPYIAVSMNTQFKPGYDPKTKKMVSKFFNPMQVSQSAGIAKNIIKNKKVQITTRLGYAAKEFFATDKTLRIRWTGDEKRGFKVDGGVEWFTESKVEFKKGIQWTNKIKLFQAIFSSISWQKDPEKNWRRLDVYWEQMFTAKINEYFLFNVMTKFIYDRDTAKGGQFLENASLGISYKFKGIEL